jgi:hypothetical protein
MRAIKHPPNAFTGFQAQLKQACAHRSRVGHSQIGTKFQHSISAMKVPSQNSRWQCKYFRLQLFIVVFDFPIHSDKYSVFAIT